MDYKIIQNDYITGVNIVKLNKICDKRGMVLHMLKSSSEHYKNFGELYFSVVYNNSVKAWKKHLKMTQNLAVPFGEIKLVCFDDRKDSQTFGKVLEINLGRENYYLVTLPPLIWYGFQGKHEKESLIVNCADMEHDTSEIERINENDSRIPYIW